MSRVEGPGDGVREVVVTQLEMGDRAQIRPGRAPSVDALLVHALRPAPELSRFFYRAIGGDWYWLDRLDWTLAQWREWTSRPGYALYTAWVDGVPAGYVELDQVGDSVEVAYFGLLSDFAGLGLGGWLLTQGLERAWEREGVRRVWVHTCELDSEAALANYIARGLAPVSTEVEYWDVSQPSPGPWRGCR